MRFAHKVKQARIEHRYSLRDVATMANISHSYLHLIEQGRVNPTVKVAERLATALGLEDTIIESSALTNRERKLILMWRNRQWDVILNWIAKEIKQEQEGSGNE